MSTIFYNTSNLSYTILVTAILSVLASHYNSVNIESSVVQKKTLSTHSEHTFVYHLLIYHVQYFRFKTQIPTKDALIAEVNMLRDILLKHNAPVVYCHNDLLCQNIIYNQQNGKWYFNSFIFVLQLHYKSVRLLKLTVNI